MSNENETEQSGLAFTEAKESREFLKNELDKKQALLAQMTLDTAQIDRANLQYETADIMLDIGNAGMQEAAWGLAKESFQIYMDENQIDDAVNALDLLYRTDLPSSVLTQVAERHSNITDQGQLNFWMDKLELNDPGQFLPKLAQVIDAIVEGNWWFDKGELRAKLPVN